MTPARDRRQVAGAVAAGDLKGFVVIPADFAHRLAEPLAGPLVEIITDGSQPNHAGFVAHYAEGVVLGWAQAEGLVPAPRVDLRPRFWFNTEIESRRFLVPGAIAIIMTMIGTLIASLQTVFLRAISLIVPARYFIASLQTVFFGGGHLAGAGAQHGGHADDWGGIFHAGATQDPQEPGRLTREP